MSYQVLALKYRPQTFDEVVGQPHVTTTLSNAILSDRVAHAILLTGPRGTGKTTIARILAKAMNCKKGPSPFPCNLCKLCTDIIEGHCSDVFEIDGASNNSVDQIRDLRENVTYMPSLAAYKIYIIDEVHMLSTAAFNALLKTLEEPPDHVMFILATTEVHKIPATILSRCQRHDLVRISLEMISNHLQDLCKKEGFCIENHSLDLIAREADGSIRDGLSLLDRVFSSAGTTDITLDQVLDSLGIQDLQLMQDVSQAIFNQTGAQLIETIERVNDSGIDLKKFYSDIICHFRNLNVLKICGKDSPAVNITDAEKEKMMAAVASLPNGMINTILQVLLDGESIVKYASHTRIAIEMVLLKLLQINPGQQIDTIIAKLNRLADQISSPPSDGNPSPLPRESEPIQNHFAPPPLPGKQDMPGVQESCSQGYQPGEGPLKPPETDKPTRTWQDFLNTIESTLPYMFTLLSKGRVTQTDPKKIIVELENGSSFDKTRLQKTKPELQKSCKAFLGKHLAINILSQNKKLTQSKTKNETKARQAAFNHPLVVEAQKMFDGEIINY